MRRVAPGVEPVAAPVVGVRSTRVRLERDARLSFCGLVHGGWTAREAIADCRAGRIHPVPAFRCSCGFWACPDDESLLHATWGLPAGMHCVVTMWGRIVEHERGWRAERMRYDEVHLPRRCHAVVCNETFVALHQDADCGLVGYCASHAPVDAVPAALVELATGVAVVASSAAPAARPHRIDDGLPLPPSGAVGGVTPSRGAGLLRWGVAVAAGAAALGGVLAASPAPDRYRGSGDAVVADPTIGPALVPSLLVLGAFALLLLHRVLLDRGRVPPGLRPVGMVVTALVAVAVLALGVAHAGRLRTVADGTVERPSPPTTIQPDP